MKTLILGLHDRLFHWAEPVERQTLKDATQAALLFPSHEPALESATRHARRQHALKVSYLRSHPTWGALYKEFVN